MDRSGFVGASEVGALLNAHPFKTPLDIYNEKMGLTQGSKPSKNKELGNFLEDGLTAYFQKWYLNDCLIEIDSVQQHLRHGHAGATLDVMLRDGSYKRRKFTHAPMDIKVIGMSGKLPYHDEYGKGGSDQIPKHVYYQLQQQCHLSVLEGYDDIEDGFIGLMDLQGRGTNIYRVKYEPHIGQMLLDVIENFWNTHIIPAQPPEENDTFMEILF